MKRRRFGTQERVYVNGSTVVANQEPQGATPEIKEEVHQEPEVIEEVVESTGKPDEGVIEDEPA